MFSLHSTKNLSATRVKEGWKSDSEAAMEVSDATQMRPEMHSTRRK